MPPATPVGAFDFKPNPRRHRGFFCVFRSVFRSDGPNRKSNTTPTIQETVMTTDEQLRAIRPLALEIISEPELRQKLEASVASGRPLRVKQGIDPTAPDVHLGHMVPYSLIRAFQDCGHIAVLIIGDVTARIGDPTDRGAARPHLDADTVDQNARTYTDQIFHIVDPNRCEVRRQSEWFGKMDLPQTIELLSRFSVAQMLAHETFRLRLDAGNRLSLHELVYPVLQARDSVVVHADVEIGGSDQRFNMLCGRDLQRAVATEPQVVVTTPILSGTDGRKMSKSFGNHIPVACNPADMYGKLMSLKDDAMPQYFRLAGGFSEAETLDILEKLTEGSLHPMKAKELLASRIVTRYHGPAAARDAAETFDSVVRDRQVPVEVPVADVVEPSLPLATVLARAGTTRSAVEARRLISQGGVSCGSSRVKDPAISVGACLGSTSAATIRVGKRRFLRIELSR